MASTRPPTRKGNLLMTLPPELRNEIYAQVITFNFYELDPTVSAKTFPRPRYIFGILRGIKAQGGTPSIAQTCQQIRAEALDVYFGRNSFALIGDDTTAATKTMAIANRNIAHQWMQLIGDDAKYLRSVRFSLDLAARHGNILVNYLVEVMSNTNGDAPTVTAIPSLPDRRYAEESFALLSRMIEAAVQNHLAETGDMGKVWRAVVERALYPINTITTQFDISDGAIGEAEANCPVKIGKLASKKYRYLPKKVNPTLAKKAVPSGQFVDLRQLVGLEDDPDHWEAEPQPTKKHARKSAKEKIDHDEDSDVIEVKAPAKKAKASQKAMQPEEMPARKAKAASQAKPTDQDDDSDVMEIEPPAKKPKITKTAKPAKSITQAGPSTTQPEADNAPKPVTRASTRKKVPRKLFAGEE